MRVLAQRAAAVVTVAAGAALVVGVLARRDREPPAARIAAPAGASNGQTPSTMRPAIAADRIEIAGAERAAITSAELADRPAALAARDRRAWRLSELLPDTYTHA